MDSIETSEHGSFLGKFLPNPLDPRDENASVKLAVRDILKESLALDGRKPIRAFAVDGANPETPMDRDDAINIEYRDDPKHGKVTVLHVTIADVASISPAANGDQRLAALDAHAAKNGETLYFSHGTAPMLPRALQDRLSLEHGKERAGLTISITFDRKLTPVHTEFSRTRITTECKSYRQAAIDIHEHGHPIQRIAVLAEQLLKRKEGATDLPHYDEKTGIYTDSEGNERYVSIQELSAYRMVQGCMIAANEAAAKLMQDSHFLFRNHSFLYTPKAGETQVVYRKSGLADEMGEIHGRLEPNRAEYSAECIGHYGLDSPFYAHVTSPIRRYADLANQRMMHWAIDVVEAVTQSMVQSEPGISKDKIRHIVWDYAPQILEKAASYKQPGADKSITRSELEKTLRSIVDKIGIVPTLGILDAAIAGIRAADMPYTHDEISKKAQQLNTTLSANRVNRKDFSPTTAYLNTVFPDTDAKLLAEWSVHSFADLLEGAARRGDNNDVFAAEVAKRIDMAAKAAARAKSPADISAQAPNLEQSMENSELDMLVRNLHSILIVAERRNDGHWGDLKKLAFQKLKTDPELAEKLFSFMQTQQQKRSNSSLQTPTDNNVQQQRESKHTHMLEATSFDRQRQPYAAASVVLIHETVTVDAKGRAVSRTEKEYCAPINDPVYLDQYKTPDEAKKMARQAALLTFFRHYGDLNPRKALDNPQLLELELALAKVKRGGNLEFLKRICKDSFDVECEAHPVPSPVSSHSDNKFVVVTIRIKQKTGEAIVAEAIGPEDKAFDKAAKKILFNTQFRYMLSLSHDPLETLEKEPPAAGDVNKAVWENILAQKRTPDGQPPIQR